MEPTTAGRRDRVRASQSPDGRPHDTASPQRPQQHGIPSVEKVIGFRNTDEQRTLFGPRDRHLRQVRDHYQVRAITRNGELCLDGDEDNVQDAWIVLLKLLEHVRRHQELDDETVEHALAGRRVGLASGGSVKDQMDHRERDRQPGPSSPSTQSGQSGQSGRQSRDAGANGHDRGERGRKRGTIDLGYAPPDEQHARATRNTTPLTAGQGGYMHAIREHDLVFCTGPAGCGKTYLATAMAVEALNNGRVRKLVLVRPAVEAGEKLGFLPGDFQAKINPYLRPIFDALGALLDYGALRRYMERDVIEIAPLAYMRGRTLENAFIILDEAQNTTPSQMKMFLTRFGRNSKVVVTGDITQVDLPVNVISGLKHARNVLGNVPGIRWCELGDKDIVRHGLVQRIVNAYEASEKQAETPLFDRLRPADARGNEVRRPKSVRTQPATRPAADMVEDHRDNDSDDDGGGDGDGLSNE